MISELRPATREVFELAEGPYWDGPRNRLLWVDIPDGALWSGSLGDDGSIAATRLLALDESIGAVAASEDGTLIVAGQERLVGVDRHGTATVGPRVVPSGDGRRCNDAGVDPAGRFVVGTMQMSGSSTHERLLRLEPDDTFTVLDNALTLSNGLAWSRDGRRLFHVDTGRRTIWSRAYEPVGGVVGPREPHIVLTEGAPDGIALDADDHLWVAVWGAGRVQRHAPTGELVDDVRLPVPNVSSVAFAGPGLGTLVVTTARSGLDEHAKVAAPDAGRLFTAPADVPGHPVPAWRRTSFHEDQPGKATQ